MYKLAGVLAVRWAVFVQTMQRGIVVKQSSKCKLLWVPQYHAGRTLFSREHLCSLMVFTLSLWMSTYPSDLCRGVRIEMRVRRKMKWQLPGLDKHRQKRLTDLVSFTNLHSLKFSSVSLEQAVDGDSTKFRRFDEPWKSRCHSSRGESLTISLQNASRKDAEFTILICVCSICCTCIASYCLASPNCSISIALPNTTHHYQLSAPVFLPPCMPSTRVL